MLGVTGLDIRTYARNVILYENCACVYGAYARKMATGGIAPSTGDGVTPQNHLVGVGPPRILAGEHQSHFRPPTNTVRQAFL